jgi:elongation factor Ts
MDIIKSLREETGLSFAQIKKALDEANGDAAAAREVLKTYSANSAAKRADNDMPVGMISAYVHSTGMMGAMITLSCETDFVAKNEEFKALAYDLAMHVAAMGSDDLDVVITEGFIKDPSMTVAERINGAIQKFGENVKLTKAVRFAF